MRAGVCMHCAEFKEPNSNVESNAVGRLRELELEHPARTPINHPIKVEVHQFEHPWFSLVIEQYKRNAWSDHVWRGRFDYSASLVVVFGCVRRGQQYCGDDGVGRGCWDEVVLLHAVQDFESIIVPLLCCQLHPLGCLNVVLLNTFSFEVCSTKVVLRLCIPCLG